MPGKPRRYSSNRDERPSPSSRSKWGIGQCMLGKEDNGPCSTYLSYDEVRPIALQVKRKHFEHRDGRKICICIEHCTKNYQLHMTCSSLHTMMPARAIRHLVPTTMESLLQLQRVCRGRPATRTDTSTIEEQLGQARLISHMS